MEHQLLPSTSKDLQSCRRHIRISVAPLLALGLLPVPLCMAYNLVMALATDFQTTTSTSCRAFNIFPSATAAARSQSKAWMLACWMQFPFCIANAWLHSRFYRRTLPRPVRSFGFLVAFVMAVNSCNMLVWGTYAESYGDSMLTIANAVCLFFLNAIVMAGTYVCSNYYLLLEKTWELHEQEFVLRLKSGLVLLYFLAVAIMWIFYFIHQKFCMPLAYSVFGLGEFISSEAFCFYLCLAYFDFYHVHICYDRRLGFHLSVI
ncbi:post-GPI attachment to proteins factor 2 [Drosophila serrata]|uniref:post-GPI attachment to proteins factor 2 n=1 Tax=Drosophila serrata TaxID=7274 RepID=UPI000A1D0468|nr:post-GPI attachment to proteins factor 2 [Drosophila serrata]